MNRKSFILACLLIISIILFSIKVWILAILILSVILLYVLNKIVLRKSNKMSMLSAQRKIGKYKYLVIGDICLHDILKKYIVNQDDAFMITAPNRSLAASYQIMLHTISILDEDGICIIVDSRKKMKNIYTIFDVPYLNMVTQKELCIEMLMKKYSFPLFYEPIKSFRILFNIPLIYKYKNAVCADRRFTDFFRNRKNQFVYLTSVDY